MLKGNGISKKYPRNTGSANYFYAVSELDFELEPGKITALTGRSGSGKTTVLNMMAGLLAPSSGTVTYGDNDIYALGDIELSRLRNEYFGVVPQVQSGIDSLTVLENVELPYALYHRDDGARNKALDLLEMLDIGNLAEVYPRELSGGELRRLSIARALIMDPDVIFADEPTGDLDDENTSKVLGTLRSIADSGAAVMLVTHENDALDYADLVYRMDGGILR